MRPLPTVLCCVLLAALSAALNCAPALQLLRSNTSLSVNQVLGNSVCGFDGIVKVCCSDFPTTPIWAQENINEDEIENHRNIHLLPDECGQVDKDSTISGIKAGLYEFPWLALILFGDEESVQFKCVGTVISARYVLTSARCVLIQEIVGVRIGDYDIRKDVDCVGENELLKCESKYQDIDVTVTIPHPGFKRNPLMNNIGLLRLAGPVDFSYKNAGAICLPIIKYLREKNVEGEIGVAAGWNQCSSENRTCVPKKELLAILSKNECITFSNGKRKEDRMANNICVGYSDNFRTGVPFILQEVFVGVNKSIQIGILSYGRKNQALNIPVVYTDVRKYVKWILDTIET